MSRALLFLLLLCTALHALSWASVKDKAGQMLRRREADGGRGTTVYELLEDLYYLDDSVALVWRYAKWALIAFCTVLALMLLLQCITLSLLVVARREMDRRNEPVGKSVSFGTDTLIGENKPKRQ